MTLLHSAPVDALLLLGLAGQPAATETAYRAFIAPLTARLGLAPDASHLAFRELCAFASALLT